MGIKDLNTFLKVNACDSIQEYHLFELKGKRVSIDVSIYFYKFLYKNPRYLESFFLQIAKLLQYGVTPIYVFDGAPPKEKLAEIQCRVDKKNEMKKLVETLEAEVVNVAEDTTVNTEEERAEKKAKLEDKIKSTNKKIISVKSEYIRNLKFMLDLLNIPYIQAEGEADIICSQLNKRGVVDLVMSDDMDLIVSGTQFLLREFSLGSNKIQHYSLDKILETLNLTMEQWVDFCILCGCDYSKRVRGMGPKKSIEYIREYKTIEAVEDVLIGEGKKFQAPKSFDYKRSRELLTVAPHYKPEYDNISVAVGSLFGNQRDTIFQFIKKNTILSDTKIRNRLAFMYPVMNSVEE